MGEQRIAAYDNALDGALKNPEASLDLSNKWDNAKLKVLGTVKHLRPLRTSSIWKTAKTHPAEIAALLAANQQLYMRYLSSPYTRCRQSLYARRNWSTQ